MKKFILFISTIVFSLIFVNKVYAQEALFPGALISARYEGTRVVGENELTYEYDVLYLVDIKLEDLPQIDEYYLVGNFFYLGNFINFRKGYIPTTNSYSISTIEPYTGITRIYLRVTTLKNAFPAPYRENFDMFFQNEVSLYIKYPPDLDSPQYNIGYSDGYNDGYENGISDGYQQGYDDGYNEGYNDGYNDFDVADYFGDRNIAKDPYIDYGTASDPSEPSTAIILINKGYGAPNIVLDKPYIIVIIKKNIYDHVVVLFDDYSPIYHYEATYLEVDDYDIYIFEFSDRINSKYQLEIRKGDVTTSEQLNEFLNDVKDNLYFSHATKLLNSSIASQLYHFGYLVGLEENISESDAYRIGYDTGYNRGYTDGNEIGYERGYEDGYEEGFDYGKTTEYEHGYKDGYQQGSNDAFLNDVAKWFGPMVLIVLIAGAYVTARNRRSED